MPRKVVTRLLPLRDACDALACSRWTFWKKWHAVFTDPRPKADRRPRVHRRVYEDELSLAVNESSKGPAAVLNFRRLMGRV